MMLNAAEYLKGISGEINLGTTIRHVRKTRGLTLTKE